MAVDELTGIDELADNYLPALTSDLNQAERLLDALYNGSWDDCVKAARSISFDRLKAARKFEDKAFLEQIKAMREEWKGVANNIREKWLTVTAEEAEYDRGLTAPALFALIDMVNAFDDAFTAAKRARNAADFNDLEHFAVRLLYTDGKPSALAKTMSEQFTEIAVDEYQDTNAVQDAIFRALSRDETNLFMVGDVKQSIYGFRLADPSIFLEKYRSFGGGGGCPPTGSRAVLSSGRISVRGRLCWTRATTCLPPSWARPWATLRTRTRRRCTSVRTTIRRPETSGTRSKSCSWMRTDSAKTMMRRTRPNSKRGLPRSGFVRCSMKAFR